MKSVHAVLSVLFAMSAQSVFADPIHFPPILLGPREIPCADFMKPYLDWASGATPAAEDVRGVGFTFVYNQQKNPVQNGIDSKGNVVGYSSGDLKYVSGALVGDVKSFFNDRTFCLNPGGGFCVSTYPFDPNKTDTSTITLAADGKMTTVLRSWGNATYHDTPVCLSNGIMYIPSKAGQSSMAVITLQKNGYRSPR